MFCGVMHRQSASQALRSGATSPCSVGRRVWRSSVGWTAVPGVDASSNDNRGLGEERPEVGGPQCTVRSSDLYALCSRHKGNSGFEKLFSGRLGVGCAHHADATEEGHDDASSPFGRYLDVDTTLCAFVLEDVGNGADVLLVEFVYPRPGGGVPQRVEVELQVQSAHVGHAVQLASDERHKIPDSCFWWNA